MIVFITPDMIQGRIWGGDWRDATTSNDHPMLGWYSPWGREAASWDEAGFLGLETGDIIARLLVHEAASIDSQDGVLWTILNNAKKEGGLTNQMLWEVYGRHLHNDNALGLFYNTNAWIDDVVGVMPIWADRWSNAVRLAGAALGNGNLPDNPFIGQGGIKDASQVFQYRAKDWFNDRYDPGTGIYSQNASEKYSIIGCHEMGDNVFFQY